MRAAIVPEFRNPELITITEVTAPVAGDNQLLIRVNVAGVNFSDLAMTRGTSPRREPPFSPGVEAAGIVEGEGTRVVYWEPMPAAYAEFAAVDSWRCVPIPDGVSDEVAVALMVQGATAHYLALDASGLSEGELPDLLGRWRCRSPVDPDRPDAWRSSAGGGWQRRQGGLCP